MLKCHLIAFRLRTVLSAPCRPLFLPSYIFDYGYICTKRCSICQQISKDEVAKIVAGFENESLLTSGGVTIAGTRYIYLSGTDRIIRAKLGKVGVHCMKTQQGKIPVTGDKNDTTCIAFRTRKCGYMGGLSLLYKGQRQNMDRDAMRITQYYSVPVKALYDVTIV